jgi:hypothetical protein
VSHPAGLPELFLDRSLGRIQVPRLLREAGLRLVTLSEHFGVPADEEVEDVTWLEEAGRRGWVVFMKDAGIRRRPAERRALVAHGVRAFCLAGGNPPAAEMAARFLANLDATAAACRDPGPFIYAVHATRIVRLSID